MCREFSNEDGRPQFESSRIPDLMKGEFDVFL